MSKSAKKIKKLSANESLNETIDISINDTLIDLQNKLEKLQDLSASSNVNMPDILSLHNSINEKNEELLKRVEKIKTDFLNIKYKPVKNIDDLTYQKYLDEISSLQGELDADTDIEKIIKEYENALNKITSCENFLKSKQMNVIYCDNLSNDEEN